jgi:hypothetical protein
MFTIIETHAFLLSKKKGVEDEYWLPSYSTDCCFTTTPSCPQPGVGGDTLEEGAAGWTVKDNAVCVQWWQSESVVEDLTAAAFIDLVCLVGPDPAVADAGAALSQLRLGAAAVREMQRRAADLSYSVKRQVEDGHTKDALQARFVAFIEDAIAILNPGLATDAEEESEAGAAAKAKLDAARTMLKLVPTPDPEAAGGKGKKGKKKEEGVVIETSKQTSETMKQFGHLFDTAVGLNIEDAKLNQWLRLVLPSTPAATEEESGDTAAAAGDRA